MAVGDYNNSNRNDSYNVKYDNSKYGQADSRSNNAEKKEHEQAEPLAEESDNSNYFENDSSSEEIENSEFDNTDSYDEESEKTDYFENNYSEESDNPDYFENNFCDEETEDTEYAEYADTDSYEEEFEESENDNVEFEEDVEDSDDDKPVSKTRKTSCSCSCSGCLTVIFFILTSAWLYQTFLYTDGFGWYDRNNITAVKPDYISFRFLDRNPAGSYNEPVTFLDKRKVI